MMDNTKDQSDVSERILSKVKHGKGCHNDVNRISHAFKVVLTSELRGRSRQNSGRFDDKERVVALFITAPEIGIVCMIMVKKSSLGAHRTIWILPIVKISLIGIVRCKLMVTLTAEILLKTKFIFTVTIKRMIIVALWATD